MVAQSVLRSYGQRETANKSDRTLNEAVKEGQQTAFLSHSHKDAVLAKGVQAYLQANGWKIYVDWQDDEMPAVPDRTTASNIKNRIIRLQWFIFLATENSMSSRWCPWEIGYADGIKGAEKIVVIPTQDSIGRNHGNEYLGLYPHVGMTQSGREALFKPRAEHGTFFEKLPV